jgi:hypothetical protein
MAEWETLGRLMHDRDCTESRIYQILTHAITAVPSYADIDVTRYYRGRSANEQEYVVMPHGLCLWIDQRAC